MTGAYKRPSRMLGDILGAVLLFAGGLIAFVGIRWAGDWPLVGIIFLLLFAFVVQFVATIITESRTTTTSLWTLSLILPMCLLLWAIINVSRAENNPSWWLLMVLIAPIYLVGVVGGTIGTKMYQQQEAARIATARAAMDLMASSEKAKPESVLENSLDDDLDDQLSKRSDDTTVFTTKDLTNIVGGKMTDKSVAAAPADAQKAGQKPVSSQKPQVAPKPAASQKPPMKR